MKHWEKIQKYYDDGHSWTEVSDTFGTSIGSIANARKKGKLKSRSIHEAMLLASEKISESMILAHKENRHPGWLSVNLNKENRTYPEEFFLNLLNKNVFFHNFTILEKVAFSKYVFDFVVVEYKIDIEIDGQHHVADAKTVEKDKVRDRKALDAGWKVFRISWSELRNNPEIIINELIDFIKNSEVVERFVISQIELQQISPRSFRAAKFKLSPPKIKRMIGEYRAHPGARKVDRPSKEELGKLVWEQPTSQLCKKFGVSDRAVGKWCEWYGIKKPPRGYWTKQKG